MCLPLGRLAGAGSGTASGASASGGRPLRAGRTGTTFPLVRQGFSLSTEMESTLSPVCSLKIWVQAGGQGRIRSREVIVVVFTI